MRGGPARQSRGASAEANGSERCRGRESPNGPAQASLGIRTFREIREEGCYYVDKTAYARRLAYDAGKHYLKRFRSRRFEAHWFETGTPTFLVGTLIGRGVAAYDLDDVRASEALLSAFDVEAIAPEALLYRRATSPSRRGAARGGAPCTAWATRTGRSVSG